MNIPGATEMLTRPEQGRVFVTERRVRLADVDRLGRCRLDATARHLQDSARDDSADSGLAHAMDWVVRRTMMEVRSAPVFQEQIELATWCSGVGARWAERRTAIRGDEGAEVDAVSLWVHIDAARGRPRRLADDFHELYGATAAGRRVSARTTLPGTVAAGAASRPWFIRATDLDVLGHVNNAAHWAPVEEVIAIEGLDRQRLRAELEHGGELTGNVHAAVCWRVVGDGLETWLTSDGAVVSSARLTSLR